MPCKLFIRDAMGIENACCSPDFPNESFESSQINPLFFCFIQVLGCLLQGTGGNRIRQCMLDITMVWVSRISIDLCHSRRHTMTGIDTNDIQKDRDAPGKAIYIPDAVVDILRIAHQRMPKPPHQPSLGWVEVDEPINLESYPMPFNAAFRDKSAIPAEAFKDIENPFFWCILTGCHDRISYLLD